MIIINFLKALVITLFLNKPSQLSFDGENLLVE